MYLEADDLAAVYIENKVQVTPNSEHLRRQKTHIPCPHLARSGSYMGGRWRHASRRFGASSMTGLAVSTQDTAEAGFAGDVNSFVRQCGHDASGRQSRKSRLVGDPQDLFAFRRAQRVGWHGTDRSGPGIAILQTPVGFPTLQRARVNAAHFAGRLQPRTLASGL